MPASPAETSTPAAASSTGPAGMRLLYVEDNRLNAILFQEALRLQPGLELRVAVDADDALAQLEGWQPDLLVLDAHLPGMNGFDLLQLLRTQPRLAQVPAFMCSADALPNELRRAQEAGFAGFWPKPIDIRQILQDLQQMTERRTAA